MAGEERHENAGKTVASRQRRIGAPMDRDDLEEAGDAGAGASDHRARDDQLADGKSLRECRARIAAGDAGREPERRARHQEVQRDAEDDAGGEPPVHVRAGEGADHVGVADGKGRGLVGRTRIAQGALDEEVHDGDGDVGEEQRGDRLVDAPRMPQIARKADPQCADEDRRRSHHGEQHEFRRDPDQRQSDRRCAEARQHQRTLTAYHDQADARRDGHRQRRQDERRSALQRVLQRERRPETAAPEQAVEVAGRLADEREEHREQGTRRHECEQRHRHVFGRAPHAYAEIGREFHRVERCALRGIGRRGLLHQVLRVAQERKAPPPEASPGGGGCHGIR